MKPRSSNRPFHRSFFRPCVFAGSIAALLISCPAQAVDSGTPALYQTIVL